MENTKSSSVAGSFYSDNADTLKNQIETFKINSSNNYVYKSRAVIVPHAGLMYSGQLAYNGLKSLKNDLKTLFIFAPAHKVAFNGLCLSSFEEWQTPLGNIKINQSICAKLKEKFHLDYNDVAFDTEHSVEIEVPLIQSLYSDINIVPVLVGNSKSDIITEIIKNYWADKTVGFVISSDLSHFLRDEEARRVDDITADMIENLDIEKFNDKQACGIVGISALINFAKESDYSFVRIGLTNSSRATGDKSSVVGYGSWLLYEGRINNFLKEYYPEQILQICRNSIFYKLKNDVFRPEGLPPVFSQKVASFVTLKIDNDLRGCIGSIVGQRPIVDDLISNAQYAAFHDPRFSPLESDEFPHLSVEVSLLTYPQQMSYKDEQDLLSQIVPYKDGIIIQDGEKQAVYLPAVWEQLPDTKSFMLSLKMKAGMKVHHFSDTFETYRFYTESIK